MTTAFHTSCDNLFDEDAIAIDCAFDGDAKNGVVPDFVVIRASAGRTKGGAAGEGQDEGSSADEQSDFLHDCFSCYLGFMHAPLQCMTKHISLFFHSQAMETLFLLHFFTKCLTT